MMGEYMKVYTIIPAYNEAAVIGSVVDLIKKAGLSDIIVVDDGSTDQTASEAEKSGARCLKHRLNRGKGAAVKTGIAAARMLGADVVVIMDGDGQHDPADIPALINPIINQGFDVVLGTRQLDRTSMPWYKVMHNQVANGITWTYSGLWVNDSQSGFRAFSAHALTYINTQSNQYEYESEIIKEIAKHRLRFTEVPITVHYTPYSQGKPQKQSITNGITTAYKMLLHRLL